MAPFQEGYSDDLFTHADNAGIDVDKSSSAAAPTGNINTAKDAPIEEDAASRIVPVDGREDAPSKPLTDDEIAALDPGTRKFYEQVGWPGTPAYDKYKENLLR